MASKSRKPTSTTIVEPSTRVFTNWSPALIRTAELLADQGNISFAADLCDWILGDDRVQGVLPARTQALLGLDPEFEPSGDGRKSKRVVRALEAEEDWWDSYPESELNQLLSWGIILGVAPAAQAWTKRDDHGGRVLAMPEFWHPHHLRYEAWSHTWKVRVASPGNGAFGLEQDLIPGDGLWILHTPYGKSRPWAMGLWRGLARLVLLKHYAIGDYARLGEAASRRVVTSDKGAPSTKDVRLEIAADLQKMGREGTIVLPPGFDYKLVEASAATKDIYSQQIEMVNKAIAVTIRGGNLTTEVTGGSLAATESQERTGDAVKLRFDAATLCTTLHNQSLIYWAQYNYGDSDLAPWPVYPVDPPEDALGMANTMLSASTALTSFVALGFEVDGDAFAEHFGLNGFLKAPKGGLKPQPAPAAADPKADVPPADTKAGEPPPRPTP